MSLYQPGSGIPITRANIRRSGLTRPAEIVKAFVHRGSLNRDKDGNPDYSSGRRYLRAVVLTGAS